MKILFITNTIQTMSGASKILRFVAERMARIYDDVSILTILDSEILNPVEGCVIHTLGCRSGRKATWRIGALSKIRKFVKNAKPDVICSFVSDACFMTRLATLGLPVKVISCDRGDPKADGFIWSKLSGWAYKRSDVCVFQLEEVRDFFGESKLKKSYIIPNPFVPFDIEPIKFEDRSKTIVSAGRFTDQKGFDLLIKAFSEVKKKHPEYSLTIYGDGSEYQDYLSLVESLDLKNDVYLPGFSKDVPNAIKDAGIFCLPSRYEGIPNALIEAMSLAIPTVAADCSPGGARFLTDDGKRGLLVPRNDSAAIAEGIIKLIEDPELAKILGDEGLAVRTLFSPDRIASLWGEVFSSLS